MSQIIIITISFLILIKPIKSCNCSENKSKEKANLEKRQYDDYDSRFYEEINEQTVTVKRYNRTASSTETYAIENELANICSYFKINENLNMNKMTDVWEIAYYRSQSEVNCFKIHIKHVPYQKREAYRKKYGDFNGSVDWDKCNLQITSYESNPVKMYHFLYGSANESGVLQNIIFTEEGTDENKTITLQEQSPDQWMVKNNLLLMRDCSNGDVIIFTRVPFHPSIKNIKAALTQFHEDPDLGSWACEKPSIEHLNNEKYKTIS